MLSMFKAQDDGFEPVEHLVPGTWVRAIDPNAEEQEILRSTFGIDGDFLSDVLDMDEQSRIEKDETGVSVILRVPLFVPEREIEYFTVPFGLVIREDLFITICLYENNILNDIYYRRIKGLAMAKAYSVILPVIFRSVQYYLRYLKEINRKTAGIERDLHKSVRNKELVQLLTTQKSLVYFTTSLQSNERLLDKIYKLASWQLSTEEQESLEDVLIDQRQAIEMARIYSDILTGTMDAFASVISNNLNVVMKRLTLVSVVLMIPTLVASIYGMNIPLPFQHQPWAFAVVGGVAGLFALIGLLLFRARQMY